MSAYFTILYRYHYLHWIDSETDVTDVLYFKDLL
jgi:hypothetical protein